MNRILPALISLLIIITTTTAPAQQVTRLSLKDCMDFALKHNYNIKNAQIDVLIQDAQNKQTLAAAYPHINGKAEFDDFLKPTATFIEANAFYPSAPAGQIASFSFSLPYGPSASITGSQLLFDGSVFVALKARNTLMELSKQTGAITEETVRYNVYKAYNSLVIAYRQYDIVKGSLAYARSLEHDLEVTRENGLAEKIDVERTSVQVNNLATDSLRIGNMLTLSEQMLKYQIGMDIRTPIVLTDTALEARSAEAAQLLTTDGAYDRIPEYNTLTTLLKLDEFNVRRYQLSALPTVSLIGATGYNYGALTFPNAFRFQDYAFNGMVGLTVNVPIYNGSLRHNQMLEAQMHVEKAKDSIEFMKQTIDYQAATSRTSLKNATLQAQSQRRNMELATDVLDLAQRKYKAGVGSNLEVNQAQTDKLQAENNYFSALLDLINAEADLTKALGLLK